MATWSSSSEAGLPPLGPPLAHLTPLQFHSGGTPQSGEALSHVGPGGAPRSAEDQRRVRRRQRSHHTGEPQLLPEWKRRPQDAAAVPSRLVRDVLRAAGASPGSEVSTERVVQAVQELRLADKEGVPTIEAVARAALRSAGKRRERAARRGSNASGAARESASAAPRGSESAARRDGESAAAASSPAGGGTAAGEASAALGSGAVSGTGGGGSTAGTGAGLGAGAGACPRGNGGSADAPAAPHLVSNGRTSMPPRPVAGVWSGADLAMAVGSLVGSFRPPNPSGTGAMAPPPAALAAGADRATAPWDLSSESESESGSESRPSIPPSHLAATSPAGNLALPASLPTSTPTSPPASPVRALPARTASSDAGAAKAAARKRRSIIAAMNPSAVKSPSAALAPRLPSPDPAVAAAGAPLESLPTSPALASGGAYGQRIPPLASARSPAVTGRISPQAELDPGMEEWGSTAARVRETAGMPPPAALGGLLPAWEEDTARTSCPICAKRFVSLGIISSLMGAMGIRETGKPRRRHHCRCCGSLVCSKCSQFEAVIPALGQRAGSVRLCCCCALDARRSDLNVIMSSWSKRR